MTEKEITRQICDGQLEKAFNAIVENYSERLYWHVRNLVCTHEDADDLLQEIFIKVWKALPAFRGESRVYTWLYRIATNETLNFLQKQKIRAALRFDDITEDMAERIEGDSSFNGDRLQRELAKAVQRLPAKQRAVFTMKYYEDMSYEDISEILGTSVGGLKASFHFAREKIEEYLKNFSATD